MVFLFDMVQGYFSNDPNTPPPSHPPGNCNYAPHMQRPSAPALTQSSEIYIRPAANLTRENLNELAFRISHSPTPGPGHRAQGIPVITGGASYAQFTPTNPQIGIPVYTQTARNSSTSRLVVAEDPTRRQSHSPVRAQRDSSTHEPATGAPLRGLQRRPSMSSVRPTGREQSSHAPIGGEQYCGLPRRPSMGSVRPTAREQSSYAPVGEEQYRGLQRRPSMSSVGRREQSKEIQAPQGMMSALPRSPSIKDLRMGKWPVSHMARSGTMPPKPAMKDPTTPRGKDKKVRFAKEKEILHYNGGGS